MYRAVFHRQINILQRRSIEFKFAASVIFARYFVLYLRSDRYGKVFDQFLGAVCIHGPLLVDRVARGVPALSMLVLNSVVAEDRWMLARDGPLT